MIMICFQCISCKWNIQTKADNDNYIQPKGHNKIYTIATHLHLVIA